MTTALRDIDGLDLDDAHQRIDSDDLLAELLPDFAARWGDGADRIERALAEGRVDEAERTAHGLAGVAGTLGLVEVAAAARRIEALLIGSSPTEAATAVPPLTGALARTVTSIRRVLGEADAIG